jgi:hypothetical protein
MNNQEGPEGILKTRVKDSFISPFPNVPTYEDKGVTPSGIVCT